MKRIFVFFIALFVFNITIAQQAWQVVNGPASLSGVTFCDMDFSGTTPYIVYSDNFVSYKATVMRYNGTLWESVGLAGFSDGQAIYTRIAMDGNTPYVVYKDVANSNKATVKKYDGSNWVTVGAAGFTPGAVDYTDITIIGGVPYVVYQDQTYGNGAAVKRFNGTSWVNVGGTAPTNYTLSLGGASYISIGNDGSSPYILYKDDLALQKATMRKFNGTNWVTIGTEGFTAGTSDFLNMAFDGTVPYVVYRETGTSNNYKAIVKKYDGSNWISVGTPVSSGSAQYTCIAINNGVPYVAYRDDANSGELTVRKYNNTSWEDVGVTAFSYGAVDYISSGFAGNIPHVVCRDAGQSSKATVMKYDICSAPFFVGLPQNLVSCGPVQVSLTAIANEGAINWYDAPTGGNLLFTGGNYSTPIINNTTTIYVQAENACTTSAVFAIEITIIPEASSSQSFLICPGETVVVGQSVYTVAGTYTDTFTAANSCDSVVTTTVSVTSINTTTSLNGTTITAQTVGDSYQWFDCDNGTVVASGANLQSFTPTVSGNYAAAIGVGNCVDTSDCVAVQIVTNGISESSNQIEASISPNPSTDYVVLTTQNYNKPFVTEIFDLTGKKVKSILINSIKTTINIAELKTGIYWLKMNSPIGVKTMKLIKE